MEIKTSIKETPLVSVIIPTYSRPQNLTRAIDSVLSQDYDNVEIIIVDDNGDRSQFQLETEDLLKPYIERGIQYIKHLKNRNGSAARNTGFHVSKGSFINFFDDDDVMGKDKISSQVSYLLTHPEVDACFCDTNVIYGEKVHSVRNPKEANWVESILLDEVFFNTSTVMFRRYTIESLNGFDETFYRHQDLELYIRFFRDYKIGKASCSPLLKYSTPNIISSNPEKSVEFMEKFLNTFSTEILSQPRGKRIFQLQYEKLVELLLATVNYKKALYCLKKSLKYGIPSIKRVIRYLYFILRPLIYGTSIVK